MATETLRTQEQAAEFLTIKPQTLAVWRATGRYDLPFVRVGRCVRYRQSDLDAFVAANAVGAGESAD